MTPGHTLLNVVELGGDVLQHMLSEQGEVGKNNKCFPNQCFLQGLLKSATSFTYFVNLRLPRQECVDRFRNFVQLCSPKHVDLYFNRGEERKFSKEGLHQLFTEGINGCEINSYVCDFYSTEGKVLTYEALTVLRRMYLTGFVDAYAQVQMLLFTVLERFWAESMSGETAAGTIKPSLVLNYRTLVAMFQEEDCDGGSGCTHHKHSGEDSLYFLPIRGIPPHVVCQSLTELQRVAVEVERVGLYGSWNPDSASWVLSSSSPTSTVFILSDPIVVRGLMDRLQHIPLAVTIREVVLGASSVIKERISYLKQTSLSCDNVEDRKIVEMEIDLLE
eukprot:PhF_6_TR37630/c0_g1_i1/m.55972